MMRMMRMMRELIAHLLTAIKSPRHVRCQKIPFRDVRHNNSTSLYHSRYILLNYYKGTYSHRSTFCNHPGVLKHLP